MNDRSFPVSRRSFLKTTTAAGLALPAWFLERENAFAAAAPRKLGPNDRPGIALIGCGGQGRGDCHGAKNYGDVVAVCDVDDKQAEQAVKEFTKDGKAPQKYNDFRKVLERGDVHVIITGTPDHWHTLVNLAASRAGKDIYTEKPLTLCIDEGKRLVEEIRKNKTILQVGSQQRSDRNFRVACELVRNNRLGKLQHIVVGLPTGPREGPFPPQAVPPGLDWDYYLGQTPKVPYNGHNCHWNFRWWYQFSGGQMTDCGAHHNDIAQWGNGTERSGPVEFQGKGLGDMIPGGYDAVAKYRVDCKYANGVTMSIVDEGTVTDRNVVGEGKQTPNCVQFIGPNGWIYVARGHISASKPEILEEPLPSSAVRLYQSDNHMGNFFDSVRSRKPPICEVEIGHRSISIAHIGVISIRMGGVPLKWDPAKEVFLGERAREANPWLRREMRKPYDYKFIA
jgi:predicted dehydrogenase